MVGVLAAPEHGLHVVQVGVEVGWVFSTFFGLSTFTICLSNFLPYASCKLTKHRQSNKKCSSTWTADEYDLKMGLVWTRFS